MAQNLIHHPYRVDTLTLGSPHTSDGAQGLKIIEQFPDSLRVLPFEPIIFTHAYTLLGQHPQRFGSDLSIYLACIKAFFGHAHCNGGIELPAAANSDVRRRLSEDLGVALASQFVVEMFGVTWRSISQIPANASLGSKRPDFQGFTSGGIRVLYEAKGTTSMSGINKALTKAMAQVKSYPEPAHIRLAVVSYVCADNRFFPSMTFVVDPPGLPPSVRPDPGTSRLLHFEKVLQFVGLDNTAKQYVRELSQQLKFAAKKVTEDAGWLALDRQKPSSTQLLRAAERDERSSMAGVSLREFDQEMVGREHVDPTTGIHVFLGSVKDAIEIGLTMPSDAPSFKEQHRITPDEAVSLFSDGTFLRLGALRRATA